MGVITTVLIPLEAIFVLARMDMNWEQTIMRVQVCTYICLLKCYSTYLCTYVYMYTLNCMLINVCMYVCIL